MSETLDFIYKFQVTRQLTEHLKQQGGNQGAMKNGFAPTPSENQRLGGRDTYEIHHKTPIHDGGEVYDMDNLVIVTPRYHKEILDPAYHFNK